MKLSLAKKPKAETWSIEELLERVGTGEIQLPDFQRLYQWKANDVVQLFDSIVRGFPIGTFLFWRLPTHVVIPERQLEVEQPASREEHGPRLSLLDGQQRLTSLAGVLLAETEPKEPRFRIGFSLETDTLRSVQRGHAWPKLVVPLFKMLRSVDLMSWAAENQLDAASQRRAFEVGSAIREYRVPAYLVIAEDEATARLIYDRVNSTGRRLKTADVFRALHDGLATGNPNSLDGLEESIAELHFGALRDRLLLQTAAAVAGLDVTKINHHTLADRKLGRALPATAEALQLVVPFLRNDAHIPSYQLLPYDFPLIALTRFFFFHKKPRPRSRELLARWVWRGALSGEHWARSYSTIQASLGAITGEDEEREVQALLQTLPKAATRPAPGVFNLQAAETKLRLLALLEGHPRRLVGGERFDAVELLRTQKLKALPKLVETKTDDAEEAEARQTIFGRIIQPELTPAMLKEPDGPTLTSLFLTREEIDAALSGQRYAVPRRARLLPEFDRFFESRARWTASDRPSLDALKIED